ncbi:MAG: hypothetical protein GF414_00335 [Candidatus Altiarchaeales archaeon]|nr:hypothetical protein [Candidatus Altiarchaeales archaeon]
MTNQYYQKDLVEHDPSVRDAVLTQLEGRTSANPILSSDVEGSSGARGATIRDVISQARTAGALIGSGRTGYYLCTSVAEATSVADSLQARASKIMDAADGMHRTIHALASQGVLTVTPDLDPCHESYGVEDDDDDDVEIDMSIL